MTMRWYVVHTFSGFEKQVARSLQEHIKNAGLQDKFGEILVEAKVVSEDEDQVGGWGSGSAESGR